MSDHTFRFKPTKVDSVDALAVKNEIARGHLAREFIAFVQTPAAEHARRKTKKVAIGTMVYGTEGEVASFQSDYFSAFMVGNPPVLVQGTYHSVRFFCREIRKKLDAKDVHAKVIVNMLASLNRMILEDKDIPRAQAVETLFLDFDLSIHWCGYDGAENTKLLEPGGNLVVIRGCYDAAVRRDVENVLKRNLQEHRPSRREFHAMVRELEAITGLDNIGYTPITR